MNIFLLFSTTNNNNFRMIKLEELEKEIAELKEKQVKQEVLSVARTFSKILQPLVKALKRPNFGRLLETSKVRRQDTTNCTTQHEPLDDDVICEKKIKSEELTM
jgi:hypothetical protein